MVAFVKPTQTAIQIGEAFRHMLPEKLIKDLHGDEAICPMCHGLGLRVVDNSYGLSNDPNKAAGHFPYKHQSLTFCPSCYNGVVHICPDCGKQIPKGRSYCDCEAEQQRQREKKKRQYQETLQKAQKYESCALGSRFTMAYSDYFSHNEGYFSDWDEFFDSWHNFVAECEEEGIPVPEKPEYVWGTEKIELELDAGSIIENACEEMYDGAMSDIGTAAINEMQAYLETWKYRYGVTSYSEDRRHAIKIPWEEDTY